MKKKVLMAALVFVCAISLQYNKCDKKPGLSGGVFWELDPISQVGLLIGAAAVPLFKLILYTSLEIDGEYFTNGQIESTLSLKSSFDMSGGTARFPSILYLILVKKVSVPGGFQTAAETKKIEVKLKVNPQTGEIPIQKIKFRKPMTIDPAKGEVLGFQMKTKGGVIQAGSKILLSFGREGV